MDATGCEPWNVNHHNILSGTRGATRENPQMLLLPAALTPTWASAELLATSHEVRCLHTLVQTVVKHGTDAHTPIETVIQTAVKHCSGVQTKKIVKLLNL